MDFNDFGVICMVFNGAEFIKNIPMSLSISKMADFLLYKLCLLQPLSIPITPTGCPKSLYRKQIRF